MLKAIQLGYDVSWGCGKLIVLLLEAGCSKLAAGVWYALRLMSFVSCV